jgi:hypothetical protein
MPTAAVLQASALLPSVIASLEPRVVAAVAALLSILTLSAAQPNASASSPSFRYRRRNPVTAECVRRWASGPRFFGDEARDIGSDVIGMTVLQQQDPLNPLKKQSHISGRITLSSACR